MKDTAIPLNLNGNTFTALLNQEQVLVKGTDYELEGENLILKSALLQKLVTQKYGINAALTAKFSAGADWRMNIIYYDMPSFISAQSPEGIFTIPAWFNGDSLATLEAVYTSGGNAGPNDWTPFKEYYKAFYPDYTTGEIKFTDEFWKEVKDGEVQLRMHFRSGAVIPYTITKTGTQIAGVSAEDAEKAAALAAEEADGQAVEVLAESADPASADTAAANSVENSAEAVQPEEASQGSDTLMILLAGSALIVVAAAVMYRRRAGRR